MERITKMALISVSILIILLGLTSIELQAKCDPWEWRKINSEMKVRIYVDERGVEHWPILNSLWSFYEFERLRNVGVSVEQALQWSKPFMNVVP